MRAALVQDGVVSGVLEVERLDFMAGLIASNTANVGDSWDGCTFTPPVPAAVVPQSVSRFQAIAALHNAGLLPAVQATVNAAGDPLVPIAWDNAQEFRRDSAMVASVAHAIPLTNTQLDALFVAAAKITA